MYSSKKNKPPCKIDILDWQFILPTLTISIIFILTNFFHIINKITFAYSPKYVFLEPYRLLTSHFFHHNLNHLLANIVGIVISRYFLKEFKLYNKFIFIYLILLLIIIQPVVMIFFDIYLLNSDNYFAYGFSAIIFGLYGFILLCSIYGKKHLVFFVKLNFKRDIKLAKSIGFLSLIGILYSFIPGISLLGHLTGFISGCIIFLL